MQAWLAKHLAQHHEHEQSVEPGVAASVLVEREGHQLVLKFRAKILVPVTTLCSPLATAIVHLS